MRPVATYFGAKRLYTKMVNAEIHWPGGRSDAPPDVPFCGFTGDAIHCLIKGMIELDIIGEFADDQLKQNDFQSGPQY
jgi:hypothetical protein